MNKSLTEVLDTFEADKAEAIAKSEIALVKIKNSLGSGTRQAAKDARGRFTNLAIARAAESAKLVSAHLSKKDDDGQTKLQQLIEHMTSTFLGCTSEKSLIGQAKILQVLDELSGNKEARKNMLARDTTLQPVRIVIVEAPTCLHAAEPKEEKTQPSFADVESVITNPAPEPEKVNDHRDVKPKPKPASVVPSYVDAFPDTTALVVSRFDRGR
jgi:hypothetical protein